jgi:DNA-binding transcriptional LysR family regulator
MKNVTLKQLRTFATVARSNTLAAAAEALHVTPPAVTIQMQLLEETIGLPLIERTPRGHRVTAAGRELVTAATRIDQILAECANGLQSLRGLSAGSATVGVVSTAKYFAPKALAAFARAHPGLEVKLVIGNREEIIDALEQYRVDVAVMGRPPETMELDREVIGDNPHIVIAAPDHPLAGARQIPLAALAAETFLVREPGSGTRTLMERRLAEAKVTPRIGMEIASNETIKQAVMAGLGIAFISAHTVAVEIADGRLVPLDVAGLPIMRQWFVVKRSDRTLLPAAAALHAFLASDGVGFLPEVAGLGAGAAGIGHERKPRRPGARVPRS